MTKYRYRWVIVIGGTILLWVGIAYGAAAFFVFVAQTLRLI